MKLDTKCQRCGGADSEVSPAIVHNKTNLWLCFECAIDLPIDDIQKVVNPETDSANEGEDK